MFSARYGWSLASSIYEYTQIAAIREMKLVIGLLYNKENIDKRGRGVPREYCNAGNTILWSVSTVYSYNKINEMH